MALRIKYRLKAFDELRTTAAAQADIAARAARLAEACGDGFEVLPIQEPRKRARAVVATTNPGAVIKNQRENTLLSNLDAAR